MYLERIDGPNDVKKLSLEQMDVLAQEMREALFRKLSKHGGHFGPNFASELLPQDADRKKRRLFV